MEGKIEMSWIVVQHYQFPIRDPYEAGHVLTEVEAGVLNWHRAGLIQKTMQRKILEAIASSEEDILPMEKLDEIRQSVVDFDATYELGARKTPRKSTLEYNLDLVANGVLLMDGELEPSEEDLERVKRTPEVQERARDLVRSSTFTAAELLSP